jgi:hypothetical protein
VIISLSGLPRCGKDTAADFLVDYYGFVRIGFADRLREVCAALNPIVGWTETIGQCSCACHNYAGVHHVAPCCYPTVGGPVCWVDAFAQEGGYDGAKTKYPEVRRLLRFMGTEVVRDMINPNYWVDYVLAQIREHEHVVIPDTRFKNEAFALRANGAIMVNVSRPDGEEAPAHRSDVDLADFIFDRDVPNTGTLADFYDTLTTMMADYSGA